MKGAEDNPRVTVLNRENRVSVSRGHLGRQINVLIGKLTLKRGQITPPDPVLHSRAAETTTQD